MAGGDTIRPEDPSPLEQVVELEAFVAGHARDRGTAREVVVRERLDHFPAEGLGVVRDVEADAERVRDPPRIVDVRERAAA